MLPRHFSRAVYPGGDALQHYQPNRPDSLARRHLIATLSQVVALTLEEGCHLSERGVSEPGRVASPTVCREVNFTIATPTRGRQGPRRR